MFNSNITGKPHYLTRALVALIPKGNNFSMWNDDYSTMVWADTNPDTLPTEAEIAAKAEELRVIDAYAVPRQKAYPSIADQLDTIYHSGIDAWKATITAVKEEFPK